MPPTLVSDHFLVVDIAVATDADATAGYNRDEIRWLNQDRTGMVP